MSNATNGAEAVLLGLKAAGVDYLFANAGTDFPPIIEALAALDPGSVPQPVTVPHETAAPAMAHGYYLATGRAQAAMMHVNVGLANGVMGVINAHAENIPMLVMSGRTPITEHGRPGARVSQIQYGQEQFDQTSLVRDLVKWNYEMRYPEQGAALVSRALAIARSEPQGPVYLSLPREPLMEPIPEHVVDRLPWPANTAPQPDPEAIATARSWLETAERPVVIAQRGDPAGRLGPALSDFAARHGAGVVEAFSIRNLLRSDDPALMGYDPSVIAGADLIIVLDSSVPWLEKFHAPGPGVRVVHIGPDPNFARMPMRSYASDLAICSDALAGIEALGQAKPSPGVQGRLAALAEAANARRERLAQVAAEGADEPISVPFMSKCISDAMDAEATVVSELGVLPEFMDLRRSNQYLAHAHSGGLGWAMPAALGVQLADRERLVVACMGDGSYMFANPVACHQIAEAMGLPVLTVVKNNAAWNAVRRSMVKGYPDGAAMRANRVPLTSLDPSPEFAKIAEASRGYAETVTRAQELPGALQRALRVVREERRQALLDVRVELSDEH